MHTNKSHLHTRRKLRQQTNLPQESTNYTKTGLVFGFFYGTNLLVLAHAFQKKTQKTPRQAIKLSTLEKFAHALGKNLRLEVA
ncbi:MAG: type II toxin-antitoxin system RelE/ParE family toxin [Candidatus Scalindua sp.]